MSLLKLSLGKVIALPNKLYKYRNQLISIIFIQFYIVCKFRLLLLLSNKPLSGFKHILQRTS